MAKDADSTEVIRLMALWTVSHILQMSNKLKIKRENILLVKKKAFA